MKITIFDIEHHRKLFNKMLNKKPKKIKNQSPKKKTNNQLKIL